VFAIRIVQARCELVELALVIWRLAGVCVAGDSHALLEQLAHAGSCDACHLFASKLGFRVFDQQKTSGLRKMKLLAAIAIDYRQSHAAQCSTLSILLNA
jgi:hypothetical protein